MIINSSQISMDASTGHKDVSRAVNGSILTRNHSGRNEPHFNLTLPDMEKFQSSSGLSSLTEVRQSSSLVENNSDEIISRSVSALTGSKASINSFDQTIFNKNMPHIKASSDGAVKRFYRIGGQQFSMNFSATKVQYEHEYLNYHSNGSVTTADGRQITFSLELSIQRTSVIREHFYAGATSGYMIDPLVLDFGNGIDNLFEQPFLFDITGNGILEAIPGIRKGCGFLALDLDENKSITSGRELFGPLSGSGFEDLAVHDLDENNWIDEKDPIFEKLLVWMNPSGGEQTLLSLKDAGVGAISLSNAHSLFNLKSPEDKLVGQVAASGLFLTENAEIKSLHDIHLNLSDNRPDRNRKNAPSSFQDVIADHRKTLLTMARQQDKTDQEKWDFWQWLDQEKSK